MLSGLNHIYCDDTGFEYKVVCTRLNSDGKVKSEKYTIYVGSPSRQHSALFVLAYLLQLFESNARPCHYMAGAKLTSPGRPASYWRTECHPKRFWDAYRDFKDWFKNITGIEWDDRLENLPHDQKKFRYAVPKLGRPVGALPLGKLPPERVNFDGKDDDVDGSVYDTDSEVGGEGGGGNSSVEQGNSQRVVMSISPRTFHDHARGLPLR
jgi:hypothetical protein